MLAVATLRTRGGRPPSERVLLVLLALATPVGLLVYSAVGTGIFAPRNLTASIPAACLVAGWLLARLPARAALAAGGLAGLGLLIGVALSLAPSGRRPDMQGAAGLIDARASTRDAYIEVPLSSPTRPSSPRACA